MAVTFGGWKAPFPLRLGSGASKLVDSCYRTVQQNRPEVLRGGGDATEVEAENRMIARMLAAGWRDTELRLAQVDPRALCDKRRPVRNPDTGEVELLSMLERWERILLLRPRSDDSLTARRAAVLGKLRSYASNARSDVQGAMASVFGSWFKGVFENRVSDVHYAGKVPAGNVHAYWATNVFPFSADYPGEYDATKPWTSGLAMINVGILPPASASQAEIDTLVGKALEILDNMLPAWMSAAISQWGPGQTDDGYYAGVSLAGLTAV